MSEQGERAKRILLDAEAERVRLAKEEAAQWADATPTPPTAPTREREGEEMTPEEEAEFLAALRPVLKQKQREAVAEEMADLLDDAQRALWAWRPPTPDHDNPLYYPLLFVLRYLRPDPALAAASLPPSAGPTREQIEALIAAGSDPLPWVPTHLTADTAPPSAGTQEPDSVELPGDVPKPDPAALFEPGGVVHMYYLALDEAARIIVGAGLTPGCDNEILSHLIEHHATASPPSAGSGETEPVRRRRPPDNDTHGISYGTDGVWWCEAHGEDCPMLRYLLAAHPAGTTRRQALVGCAQHTQTGFNHQCRACGAANSTPPTPETP